MSEEYEDYGDYEDDTYDEPVKTYPSEDQISYGDTHLLQKKKSCTFVTTTDIKHLISKKILELEDLTGLSRDELLILSNFFKWRKDTFDSDYFGNEDQIRIKAHLDSPEPQPIPTDDPYTCPLCFDTLPLSSFDHLSCNHYLCQDCFRSYIAFHVDRPENLFFWSCPYSGCKVIIPESFNLKYVDSAKTAVYDKKLAVAYADSSRTLRWCPAPGCEYGVEVENAITRSITCPCGNVYCFKCGLEDHQPNDCDMAKEWTGKDKGGGANAQWLLAFTKDCPKCKRPIEKNQGCNYMRCRHPGCGQEFCWLCLADWKTHNDHFKCNKYDKLSNEEKKNMDDEKSKERQALQKYAFYFERYQNNHVAMNSANKLLKEYSLEQKDLALALSLTLTQLEFTLNACKILVRAKRILKWSYSYGYYIENDLQRNLYEIIQQQLDIFSGELHVLLEKDYAGAKNNIGDFTVFKDKVLSAMHKTEHSTNTFLIKMEEFENNLLEEQLRKEQADRKKEEEKKMQEIMKLDGEDADLQRALLESAQDVSSSMKKIKRKASEQDTNEDNNKPGKGRKNVKKTKG